MNFCGGHEMAVIDPTMRRMKVIKLPPSWPDLRVMEEPTWKDWRGWTIVNLIVWPIFILDCIT